MIYSKLTPLHLRKMFVLMYGSQNSCSLPFLLGTLPNKNKIREKNGKIHGAVILNVRMQKEHSPCIILSSMLQGRVVNISEDDTSSYSTIDVNILENAPIIGRFLDNEPVPSIEEATTDTLIRLSRSRGSARTP